MDSILARPQWTPLQTGPEDPLVLLGLFVGLVVIAGLAVLRKMVLVGLVTGDGDAPDPDSLTNCPACGARNPADRDSCDHCCEPIPEAS